MRAARRAGPHIFSLHPVDVLLVKARAFKAVATGDVQSGGASLKGVPPPGTGPAVSNAGYASEDD